MQPNGGRQVVISFRLEHLLGWGFTILFCIIPVIMWIQIHPLSTIHGFGPIMLSIGRVTGLVGMVMYALNLLYSTRLRFLEKFFGGLNRVYIAHHMLGGLALVLLAMHPVFLSLRYINNNLKQAALILVPNGLSPVSALFNSHAANHPIVLEQWAIFFGFVSFWTMVILLLITFFIRIPYHIWLFTHKFLGAAFFIAYLHVLFISSDTSTHPVLKYYILLFSAVGVISYIYRTLAKSIFIRNYEYRVDNVVTVAGNVTKLQMTPVMERISYKPGQFIFIKFTQTGTKLSKEWHPFSISSGDKAGYLEVSVKGLGDYTNYLANIKPGTIATIEGAYGRFSYNNFKNLNQIWVAGGIGVTPFISMAKSLPDSDYRIDLYYAVKTASELIDWEAMFLIAENTKGKFRYIPYIADQNNGRLSADYIENMSPHFKSSDVFICGPPPMMTSLIKQFKKKGIAGARIHSEEFGMS